MPVYRVDDKEQLGSRQEVEVFETEHHLYRVPFHYENVSVDYWYEYSDKGIEIAADAGSITIVEEKAIVSVILVGTGCSSPGYNVVEWWTQDEDISTTHGQLIKRQRIDNLKGQHNAWIQRALTHKPDFKSVEEANKFMDRMQRNIYAMTQGYYVPGSIMSGLYENTAYFRIGDVTKFSSEPKAGQLIGAQSLSSNQREDRLESLERTYNERLPTREVLEKYDCHKIVIRGDSQDFEDPGTYRERFPADYAFRLIDVVVKK